MRYRWLLALSVFVVIGCGSSRGPQTQSPPRNDSSTSERQPHGGVAPHGAVEFVSHAAVGPSHDWPCFRGPDGMGTSSATGLPTTWSDTENLVWKAPLPGAGASSPIVHGDRIYLTCYTGYFVTDEAEGRRENLKRHLLAIDLASGKVLWERTVPAKLPEEESIRDHGFAANTPAADDERVYVFFGKSGVHAYDHAGEHLWEAEVGSGTNGWGTSASPVLYDDLVFINASVESESLIALDRRSGEERWRTRGIKEAWNTPVVVKSTTGRDELVMAIQGSVRGYDPKTGELLWTCKTDIGWYMVPSIVAADGVVYCLGGRSGVAALAVRTGGKGDVTDTHRLWTSLKGSNVSSPVYHDGHLYWAHDSRGVAYCMNAATGDVVYEERLERPEQFYSSALLADGKLYYVARDGRTFVLAAEPKFKQLAINRFEGDRSVFNASPAVADSRILLRSDKYLYCIGNP